MTDSRPGHREPRPATASEKRERLVHAASRLAHRQGTARTTLADIAAEADVPLGNVYYYFKTKDEIIDAVVDAHAHELTAGVARLQRRHRTPASRLKGLVDILAERSDEIAQFGCVFGTLCAELAKRADGSDSISAPLLGIPLAWAEEQFRLMGRHRDAHDLALELISSYQGAALVSSTLGDAGILSRLVRRLKRWIDGLARNPEAESAP